MPPKRKPFVYKPLEDAGDEQRIRLLKLLPGLWDSVIRCRLQTVSLDEKRPPQYIALSYAWGDPSFTCPVMVGSRELLITTNLKSALRQLRLREEPLVLWVDAICVDQKNARERSRQVQLMTRIYSKAFYVAVWLGPFYIEAELAFEVTNEKSNTERGLPLKDAELSEEYLCALEKVFRDCSWWSRLWVVQEIAHSRRSKIILLCGRQVFYWNQLRSFHAILVENIRTQPSIVRDMYEARINSIFERANALESIRIAHDDSTTHFTHKETPSRIREGTLDSFTCDNILDSSTDDNTLDNTNSVNRRRNIGISFEATIALVGNRKCTDPRDRIFALQSLSGGHQISTSDYTKTIAQTYFEATIGMIKQTKNLNSICNSYPPEVLSTSHPRGPAEIIPGWVPDWDSPRQVESLIEFELSDQLYDASLGYPINRSRYNTNRNVFASESPWQLTLEGVLFDTITHISTKVNTSEEGWQWEVCGWKITFPRDRPYPTGEHRRDVFFRTLLKDVVRAPSGKKLHRMETYDVVIHRRLFLNWFTNLVTIHSEEHQSPVQDASSSETFDVDFGVRFEPALTTSLNGWSFCMTEKGYIGLAGGRARIGDKICAVLGAKVPLVVRNQGDSYLGHPVPPGNAGWYAMTGTAYIHGIMDGEAFRMKDALEDKKICLI